MQGGVQKYRKKKELETNICFPDALSPYALSGDIFG